MDNKKDFPFIQAEFTKEFPHDDRRDDSEIVAYQKAIRALDLDEQEEKKFLDLTQLNTFRTQLEKRLKKTKLWNYAPDQREAVGSARSQLQDLLGITVND